MWLFCSVALLGLKFKNENISTLSYSNGRYYFPPRLINHSAIPVRKPSTTSGRIHSRGAPITYASTASTQHEPATHIAIAKESGSLSICTPFGRCSTEIAPTPPRPVRGHQPLGA